MPALPKRLVPFFWYFIKSYQRYLFALLFVGLFWGIYNALSPYLLKVIIDTIADFDGDKATLFSSIQLFVILYMILWVAIAVNFRMRDWIVLKFHPSIRHDMAQAMFAYLNGHSYRYFQNNFAGSLTNKIGDMMNGTVSILLKLEETFATIAAIVIAVASMFFVHSIFAMILLVWLLFFTLVSYYFTKHIHRLSNIFAASKTVWVGKVVDSVSNVINMRLFARNHYENAYIKTATDDTVSKDRAMQKYVLKMHIGWDLSIIFLMGGLLYALINLYSEGLVTLGDFTFIITVAVYMVHNLWNLASQWVQFSEELGKCSQALTMITQTHDIPDTANAKSLIITKGEIEFDQVSFHYDQGKKIFNNKNVVIPSGQKVGLVGFSGSGKTTFVHLILRFFEIESGRILIDQQDIRDVTQNSLREQIAMIPQDTSLFHRTLMENIRYGYLEASDEEVINASKRAHCHEFISQLPEGYDSLVGERGIKLSGGQRQRIAIARAMLKDAPILILDEATSALDSVTEKYIQEGLNLLMKDRTTIIIAHRLSTLSAMDRILVFDQGHIIEDGSHEELLAYGGHYAKLWQMQAGGFLPEQPEESLQGQK